MKNKLISDKGYNFGWILQNEEIDKLLEILDYEMTSSYHDHNTIRFKNEKDI